MQINSISYMRLELKNKACPLKRAVDIQLVGGAPGVAMIPDIEGASVAQNPCEHRNHMAYQWCIQFGQDLNACHHVKEPGW